MKKTHSNFALIIKIIWLNKYIKTINYLINLWIIDFIYFKNEI